MNIDDILKQVLKIKGSAFFYTPTLYKNSKSYIFNFPKKTIRSASSKSLNKSIDNFYGSINNNNWGYCILNYEAGYCFENKLIHYLEKNPRPLFQGFIFSSGNISIIDSKKIKCPPFNNNFAISSFKLNTTKRKYDSDIKRIKKYIEEGDTYQVNCTVKGKFKFHGDLINQFKKLVFSQSAKYSAFINLGDKVIISLSPELFFEQNKQKLKTSPMKGTIKRGINNIDDELQKYKLQKSEKNRAENLMIVDLLRNDLGKISEYGSVKVSEYFKIEKYESLFQMVSTVESRLKKNVKLPEIIKNIFPCGSITGAPKMRTMQIIKSLEIDPREVYTGAIGLVKKDKSVFNVAIRTIEIDKMGNGKIGLGSGIVWDSDPKTEFEETLLKSKFLSNTGNEYLLFETMRYENGDIYHLVEHLERLKKTADYFLFLFDEKLIKRKLKSALKKINDKMRIKLTLNKRGEVNVILSAYPVLPDEINVIISEKKVSSQNPFQYFKTDNRIMYTQEYNKYYDEGFFDVIFLNEKGELVEGSISNIFIKKSDTWLTPAVNCGLLPGIERRHWLSDDTNAVENILHIEDLIECEEMVLTNSLRGRIKVNKLYLNRNEFREI